ncbi:unnamed protein product [Lactuca virosa]|uniref:Uncharacterized protein n=1 Tax=Lactuca virosa TaxID=75947 RepID=A0AAU9LSX2_9ASTR|nr:unnamed protein product [Lactuca virosa]
MLPHLAYRNSLSTVSAAAYRLRVAMWFYCSCKSFCSDNMFMWKLCWRYLIFFLIKGLTPGEMRSSWSCIMGNWDKIWILYLWNCCTKKKMIHL